MNAIAAALFGRLNGDAQLGVLGVTGVFEALAPQGQALPVVTFALSASDDSYLLGRTRGITTEEWLIKGITREPSAKKAGQISDRIDALLTDYALPVSGKTLVVCHRTGTFAYPETDEGVTYWHAGGRFAVQVQ